MPSETCNKFDQFIKCSALSPLLLFGPPFSFGLKGGFDLMERKQQMTLHTLRRVNSGRQWIYYLAVSIYAFTYNVCGKGLRGAPPPPPGGSGNFMDAPLFFNSSTADFITSFQLKIHTQMRLQCSLWFMALHLTSEANIITVGVAIHLDTHVFTSPTDWATSS